MSSTNKTLKLQLPLFDVPATDKPSWTSDIGPAMAAIDSGVLTKSVYDPSEKGSLIIRYDCTRTGSAAPYTFEISGASPARFGWFTAPEDYRQGDIIKINGAVATTAITSRALPLGTESWKKGDNVNFRWDGASQTTFFCRNRKYEEWSGSWNSGPINIPHIQDIDYMYYTTGVGKGISVKIGDGLYGLSIGIDVNDKITHYTHAFVATISGTSVTMVNNGYIAHFPSSQHSASSAGASIMAFYTM